MASSKKGNKLPKSLKVLRSLSPAYTVQELPPLTQEELEELARNQMARNSVAD